ncbi:glycosyl transferase family 36 [candidate division KSB1 bacterium]|nr:glycosyl transferase family 36 [candidate division KSB1 bacterium]
MSISTKTSEYQADTGRMMEGKFSNKYGYFTPDGNEYIIVRPDTPKPWINVISNGDYGLIISQAGGGFSWRSHSNFNRLTRWHQDLIQDHWGKFIYLLDRANRTIWSAAYQPVKHPGALYQCRHGIGYSVLSCQLDNIHSEWTLFAAESDPLELWILRLENSGKTRRTLSIFTYLEWCLGFAPDNHREFHKAFIETEFDPAEQIFLARKRLWEVPDDKGRHWNRDWPYTSFHACSEKVTGYDGDKEIFLGNYGDLKAPASVRQGMCENSSGKWGDGMASLHVEWSLSPGESKEMVFLLGAVDQSKPASDLIKKYRNIKAAQKELATVKQSWQQRLAPLRVETPDFAFDVLTNTWLKYQTIACRLMGRAAYYQQSGAFGFRDQLQDSLLMLPLDSAVTRRQLLLHAAHQFADGSVYHWWHPITETGLRTNVSDNFLWLPFVLSEYLKETGDFGILHEEVRFVDNDRPASMWQHGRLAISLALQRRSERGLPFIGDHDWNDGLNAVGNGMKGESIWLGHFLHRVLLDFADIAFRIGQKDAGETWLDSAEEIKNAVREHGWDGAWYWRASKDDGGLVGSASCEQGKIFLNAQTWAVIGGTASDHQQIQAMESVEKWLDREFGPILLWPAYSQVDADIGYLSRYAPGRRENGGLYTHAAAWAIWAETLLGRGDKAWKMYEKLSPILRGLNPDLYHVEPYVTPGNVEGPDSPYFGRGGWTWYTGSAAWLFKVSVNSILGVQATLDGLQINPCIPSAWKSYSVQRRFRGAEYIIHFENPDAVQNGLRAIEINGEKMPLSGSPRTFLLPIFAADTKHEIRVTLGNH